MRDKRSGRHAAAVARYALALATELGCSEEERDVIHAAGLLHEIGKFTWPDRVLQADVVDEQDQPIVRSHPQEGAILVGALDGYGEVADAILYHHERVDGLGYPAGLIGKEIPIASRILAICSTYDTMTAGTATEPMSPRKRSSSFATPAERSAGLRVARGLRRGPRTRRPYFAKGRRLRSRARIREARTKHGRAASAESEPARAILRRRRHRCWATLEHPWPASPKKDEGVPQLLDVPKLAIRTFTSNYRVCDSAMAILLLLAPRWARFASTPV